MLPEGIFRIAPSGGWKLILRKKGKSNLAMDPPYLDCLRCTDDFWIPRAPPDLPFCVHPVGTLPHKERGAAQHRPVEQFSRGVAALHAWPPWPTTRPRSLLCCPQLAVSISMYEWFASTITWVQHDDHSLLMPNFQLLGSLPCGFAFLEPFGSVETPRPNMGCSLSSAQEATLGGGNMWKQKWRDQWMLWTVENPSMTWDDLGLPP